MAKITHSGEDDLSDYPYDISVGYIPYLNMFPFHHGFGPQPLEENGLRIRFQSLSPRVLGLEAEAGRIDAGAMSLIDLFRLEDHFEPLGNFGIGVKRAAGSVLVFSKVSLSELKGVCAVTDETSTSVRLLQVLLEKRYGIQSLSYGRIASSLLFDGDADSLLLIGDEALRAKEHGIKGLPVVTDLGEEWYHWQGVPFAFARWVVRKSLPEKAKKSLADYLEKSLNSTDLRKSDYLSGFNYRLTEAHERSIKKFKGLLTVIPAQAGIQNNGFPLTACGNDGGAKHA